MKTLFSLTSVKVQRSIQLFNYSIITQFKFKYSTIQYFTYHRLKYSTIRLVNSRNFQTITLLNDSIIQLFHY